MNGRLKPVEHDQTDLGSSLRLLERCRADEIYNLAAQSFVGVSFVQPTMTGHNTGLDAARMLEANRIVNPQIRFYKASPSEMFGRGRQVLKTEQTPFYSRSPYGVAKLCVHWTTVNYRAPYGLFAASGNPFNHESLLRGKEFVSRKIMEGVARIVLGKLHCSELDNRDTRPEWGFAKDYIDGMYRMLQAEEGGTSVFATNRTKTVRRFATMSFAAAGIDLPWQGAGRDPRPPVWLLS